ncbi:MAG: hypothetical protein Q4F75_09400, partial [Pseudomonadota bacterium]|nr:hypothetical protein [Pseudomonadota bacterium]
VHGTCHGDCCSDGSIEACDARCGGSGCCSPKKDETGCTHGTYSCSDGCGGYRDCCKICDPEDRNCNCPGKVYCGDTKTGSGASCTSGGKTFYETCLVKETCVPRFIGGGTYIAAPNSYEDRNYTYIRPYCTTQTGQTLNLYVGCQSQVEGVQGKCYGKQVCPNNVGHQNNGSIEPCQCAGNYWFDKCDDTCNLNDLTANGGTCGANAGNSISGHYYVKDKCTTLSGQVVKYWGMCERRDCLGNKGPCYGKTRCSGGAIAVDPCTCGGYTYGSSCVVKCPYEQTAADCSSGQTFTQRCKDNAGTWYGECK